MDGSTNENAMYRRIALGTIGIVAIGTIFYHFQEGFSWLDSFYFTIVTLTTVGYGDLSPQTELGKLFTVGFIVVGISLLGMVLSTWTKARVERKMDRSQKRKEEKSKDHK